jgi:N-acetylglucosaminyl-diphospho-decaprenol L-rhamnosyltransferase
VKTISTVIVSWNSGEDLVECVASLARARRESGWPADRLDLVVLDNHSDSFPENRIRELWPDVRIAVLAENIGFGPAANHGAAHGRGDILLFLNPDTRAVGNPFAPIAEAFASHPDWVAVAPRLVEMTRPVSPVLTPADAAPLHNLWRGAGGEDTQEEFQLRRLPRLGSAFRELFLIDRLFPRNRGRLRDRYLDRDRDSSFEVEQPAAAALAVRKSAFRKIGGFDPRFVPAWWEDVDLCRRLASAGKIFYVPAARFEHTGGHALGRLGYDRFLPLYYRNAISYWRKTAGTLSVFAYRALLVCGMSIRLALLPFRRGDPRPKSESFRAYRSALAVAVSGK